ncbi:hypothetical protein N2152v2_003174 [Parachlorella kessleri]
MHFTLVITVVNRDAVERVAPPPTLRVVEFAPSPWRLPDVTPAAVPMEDGHPDPVADFMARLSRARRRLQCASDYFEIKWQQGLHRQLGLEGVTGERVMFDPSVPGTTASKLDSMLGSVQHVVENLGPWCGAVCFQEVLKSLLQSNPQPYWYLQQQGQGGSGRGFYSGYGASRQREGDQEMQASTNEKLQALANEIIQAGFCEQEVEQEQDAANLSAAEVLAAFGELLLSALELDLREATEGHQQQQQQHGRVQPQLDGAGQGGGANGAVSDSHSARWQQFHELLVEVQHRVRHRQLLQDVPVRAMRIVLSGVAPSQLEEAVISQPGSERVIAFPTPACASAEAAPPAAAAAAATGSASAFLASGSTGGGATEGCAASEARRTLAAGLIHLSFTDNSGTPKPGPTTATGSAAPCAADKLAGTETGCSLLVTPKLRALVRQLLLFRDVTQGASPATAAERQTEGDTGGRPSPATPWSGIVFVTQRIAAWGLHCMLAALPALTFLRTSAIMGAGARVGEGGYGVKEQSRILKRFRSGELNLLVSTAVAEEGIDVKSCQLVVRFDLPITAQSYIQSRGRARMENSELVMMVQQGEPADMQMVSHMVSYEQQLRQEVLLNIERLQAGQLSDNDDLEDEDAGEHDSSLYYEVPATGARLTIGNAQLLLNNYVSKLPADRYVALRPLFRTEQLGQDSFRTRIFLPNNCPLATADGLEQPGRRLAIAAAALEACKRLHQLGALNDHLLPAMSEEPSRPQQRKREMNTDEVLEDKAHEPAVPVIIQFERPRLMQGKLGSLKGQERVTLHLYRWVQVPASAGATTTSTAAAVTGAPFGLRDSGDSSRPEAGELCLDQPAAMQQQQQQQQQQQGEEEGELSRADLLVGGLASLGVLLMGPLPEGLPPCDLRLADPASPHGSRLVQLCLAPAGCATFTPQQFSSLLACHGVLLRHMFSRGAYCGAAARPEAASARHAQRCSAAEQGTASSRKTADCDGAPPPASAGGEGGACSPVVARPLETTAATDSSHAQRQLGHAHTTTSAPAPGLPQAGPDPVHELVLRIMNRLVLLHDQVPLVERREEVAAPDPGDTSFLLAPCTAAGNLPAGIVDWQGVQSIIEGDGYEGTTLPLLQAGGPAALGGRVVVTEYNSMPYVFRGLAGSLTLSSTFPVAETFPPPHSGVATVPQSRQQPDPPRAGPPPPKRRRVEAQRGRGAAEGQPDQPCGSQWAEKRPRLSSGIAGAEDGQTFDTEGHGGQDANGMESEHTQQPEQPMSYGDYYAKRWGRGGLCAEQPLIRAGRLPRAQVKAASHPGGAKGGSKKKQEAPRTDGSSATDMRHMEEEVNLVPELCLVCPVPFALWQPLSVLPRLLWHTEAAMQAAELRGRLSVNLPPEKMPSIGLVCTALTAKSALEGSDYERLETLGDGFIKYAVGGGGESPGPPYLRVARLLVVSVQLFAAHRTYHEGQLTKRKDRLVANRRLAERALGLGLDRHLRLVPFSVPAWLDPEPLRRSDKVLADGLEALVGAFLVAGGEEAARAFLQFLGIVGPWREVSAGACAQRAAEDASGTADRRSPEGGGLESCTDFGALEGILGYTFRCRRLADEALTHCSWPGSGSACYQRLEFVGDAVLDILVTRYFFTSFKSATPSKMHDMRSVQVNAERLALVAVRRGLHRHIRHQSPRLFQHIEQFVSQWRDEVNAMVVKLGGDPDPAFHVPPPPLPRGLHGHQQRLGIAPAPHKLPHPDSKAGQEARGTPGHRPHSLCSNGGGPSASGGRAQQDRDAHSAQQGQQEEAAGGESQAAPQRRVLTEQEQQAVRDKAELKVLHRCTFGFEHMQAPKVLSDVLEALVGAVYVDCGGDLGTVWDVVRRLLHPLVTPTTVPVHPIRHIQELVQRYAILPKYEELGRDTDTGAVRVRLSAAGVALGESWEGANFRSGCRLAAKDAVDKWFSKGRRAVEEALRAEKQCQEQAAAEKQQEREGGHQPVNAAGAGSHADVEANERATGGAAGGEAAPMPVESVLP